MVVTGLVVWAVGAGLMAVLYGSVNDGATRGVWFYVERSSLMALLWGPVLALVWLMRAQGVERRKGLHDEGRAMKRLIEKGLMFGNLIEVSSPALVERYNRAMKALCGRETKLTDFYIDLSGFSPEVGEELGDMAYLNPNGCNRSFILLTTAQKSAPLLDQVFSTSRAILQDYIETNEAQLFALTARDAVIGTLQSGVYEMATAARLLDVRQITVEADTTGGHVAAADQLGGLIERFRKEPAGWRDDVLIASMIELAKKTGDVTRVPITLLPKTYSAGQLLDLAVWRDLPVPRREIPGADLEDSRSGRCRSRPPSRWTNAMKSPSF